MSIDPGSGKSGGRQLSVGRPTRSQVRASSFFNDPRRNTLCPECGKNAILKYFNETNGKWTYKHRPRNGTTVYHLGDS